MIDVQNCMDRVQAMIEASNASIVRRPVPSLWDAVGRISFLMDTLRTEAAYSTPTSYDETIDVLVQIAAVACVAVVDCQPQAADTEATPHA